MPRQVQPWLRIREVFHPTDSSPDSEMAFLHALRGSTTERVLRQASCPLLTMSVGSFLG